MNLLEELRKKLQWMIIDYENTIKARDEVWNSGCLVYLDDDLYQKVMDNYYDILKEKEEKLKDVIINELLKMILTEEK